MARVVETTVYTYDELDEDAKETARQKYVEDFGIFDTFWADSVIEDFIERLEADGVTFDTHAVPLVSGKTRHAPKIFWGGFGTQGGGAQWFGAVDLAVWLKARKLANRYRALYTHVVRTGGPDVRIEEGRFGGSYTHSGYMVAEDYSYGWNLSDKADIQYGEVLGLVKEWARSEADKLYRDLWDELDYQTSDEAVEEAIRANEYEYEADGTRA